MQNIQKLIENYLSQNRLRKVDLIRKMRYKNEAKGLRRLEALIENGKYSETFIADLAEAMNMELDSIKKVLEIDENRRVELENIEARKRFRPHILLINENKRPSSLLPLMFLGVDYFKKIVLPEDIAQSSLWEQIERVKEIFSEYLKAKKNIYTPFGKITGYKYYYEFDEYVEFTIEGEIKGYYEGSSIQGQIITKIGGKQISGAIFR
jgi:hypothetical protein